MTLYHGLKYGEIYWQADENKILQSYGLHVESNDLAVEDLKSMSVSGMELVCPAVVE